MNVHGVDYSVWQNDNSISQTVNFAKKKRK